MTGFEEINRDILDRIFAETNRPGSKVVVSIRIDAGKVGVVEYQSTVSPKTMTRLTDLIDDLEQDQRWP
jgi:hypothetical protein